MEIDLKILLSTVLFLLCSFKVDAFNLKGGIPSNHLHHVSAIYSAEDPKDVQPVFHLSSTPSFLDSKTSASSTSSPNFETRLKVKSNLVAHYAIGGSASSSSASTEKKLEETFPDQIFASGLDLEDEDATSDNSTMSAKLQQPINYTSDENLNLSIETTSLNPYVEEDSTKKPSTDSPLHSSRIEQAKQIETEDEDRNDVVQVNEIDNNQILRETVGSKGPNRVKAAVLTKHSFEFRPIQLQPIDHEAIHEPKIIEVEAKTMPLEIHFKSASSRIKLVQSHKAELNENEIQRSSVDEEPQRLFHVVRKPIIQEVREIITPYRKIVQEIQPVMEEIQTVVSHESDESRERLAKLKQERAQKQQQQQKHQQVKPNITNKKQTQSILVEEKRQQHVDSKQQHQQQQQTVINSIPSTSRPHYVSHKTSSTSSSASAHSSQESQSVYDDVDERENNDESESEGSVGLVGDNDLSAIIPARLMNQIIAQYGTRSKQLKDKDANKPNHLQRLQQTVEKNETNKMVKYDEDKPVVQQRLESGKTRPLRLQQQILLSPVAKLTEQSRARQQSQSYSEVNANFYPSNNNQREIIVPRTFRGNEFSQQQQNPQQQQPQNSYASSNTQMNYNGNNQFQNNRLTQRPQQSHNQHNPQQQQQFQQLRESESRHFNNWQMNYNPRIYEPFYGSNRNQINNVYRSRRF